MQYRTLLSPWTDRSGRFSFLKTGTFTLVCIPALLVAVALWRNELGPLPYKEALHQIGDWTVRFLIATLALTPLQRILRWPRLALIRRMLGVTTFTYALTHFTLYVVNEKFDLIEMRLSGWRGSFGSCDFCCSPGFSLTPPCLSSGLRARSCFAWQSP